MQGDPVRPADREGEPVSPVHHDERWIAPWTPGLPQAPCRAGADCHSRPPHSFVAMVLEDGLCPSCAKKQGRVGRDAVEPEAQLPLPFWAKYR